VNLSARLRGILLAGGLLAYTQEKGKLEARENQARA